MSDHRVLQRISRHLRGLLYQGLEGTEAPFDGFTAETTISLDGPLAENAKLSLYLYEVLPSPHLNNGGPIAFGAGEQRHRPLSLELGYLLTPLTQAADDNLAILGRCLQILDTHATIRVGFLDSDLRPAAPVTRLHINPVPLEELTRIWSAFNKPFRLSVAYRVAPVSIDSARLPDEGVPVRERLLDTHQVAP